MEVYYVSTINRQIDRANFGVRGPSSLILVSLSHNSFLAFSSDAIYFKQGNLRPVLFSSFTKVNYLALFKIRLDICMVVLCVMLKYDKMKHSPTDGLGERGETNVSLYIVYMCNDFHSFAKST